MGKVVWVHTIIIGPIPTTFPTVRKSWVSIIAFKEPQIMHRLRQMPLPRGTYAKLYMIVQICQFLCLQDLFIYKHGSDYVLDRY